MLSDKLCLLCNEQLYFSKSRKYNLTQGYCRNKSCKKHKYFNYKVYVDGECSWLELKVGNYIIEKVLNPDDGLDYEYRVFCTKKYYSPALVISLKNLNLTNDYDILKSKLNDILLLSEIYV